MFSYVVVADSGQARLLRVSGPLRAQRVVEFETLQRPSVRAGGRARVVTTPHDTSSDYDPHGGEIARFATALSKRLDELQQTAGTDEFVLVVEPHFLGMLRKKMSAQTCKMVSHEVSRDFVHADVKKIMQAAFPAANKPA
jgi:protein required for attachment to host cells